MLVFSGVLHINIGLLPQNVHNLIFTNMNWQNIRESVRERVVVEYRHSHVSPAQPSLPHDITEKKTAHTS